MSTSSLEPAVVVACSVDPEVFFSDAAGDDKLAQALCIDCPIRRACLEKGLTEDWGVWGGRTRTELANALNTKNPDKLICLWCGAPTADLSTWSEAGARWPVRGIQCDRCGLRWINSKAFGAWDLPRPEGTAKPPREPAPIPHGTPSGYSNRKCRCSECRASWNVYKRDYNARKKAAL